MNTPNHCGDDTINELWESGPELPADLTAEDLSRAKVAHSLENWEAALHPEMRRAEGLAKVFDRLEEIMHEPPVPKLNAETLANGRVNEIDLTRRRYDIDVDYDSFRPVDQRWRAIDLNSYDGAPDAEAPCTFIGWGASEKQARMDLLDQFADYDQRPRPKSSRVIHSSAFEPNEYSDE